MRIRLKEDTEVTGYTILSSNAVLVSTKPRLDAVQPYKKGTLPLIFV